VGFRTSAATSKAPRTDGMVYIVKDVDQASISIAVGDTYRKTWSRSIVRTGIS
jgi:hypothetical protein